MATTVEDISSTKKRLKIEIPADIIGKEYSDSLNNIRQRARIPGFRPGKAPISMIEKKFGGDIKGELIEKLVPVYYDRAVKEAGISPVAMPKIENSLDFSKNEPMVFSLTVEVRPRIDDLNYSGLKVKGMPLVVEETEVDETLQGLRNDRAMFDAVDREIGEDDLLVLDYVKLDPSGEKEIVSQKDQVMNLGNKMTPPGILEKLIGRKKGDTVEVVLPSAEDNMPEEGSEKGDRLRITIKEVKEKKLPDIDDEFAKDFGNESLAELKDKIREGLLAAKQDNIKKQQKAAIIESLVSAHSFDVPEALTSSELEHLVDRELYSGAMAKQEDAAAESVKAELADKLRPKAVNNVKATIILDEIAGKEKVTVSEAEVKDRIAIIAKQFQATPDAIVNMFTTRDGSLDTLRHNLREEKVLELLLASAEITEGA